MSSERNGVNGPVALTVSVFVVGVTVAGGLAIGGAVQEWRDSGQAAPVTAAPPILVVTAPAEPYGLTVNDCDQDGARFPCITVDDAIPSWVVVWPSGRRDRIEPCNEEDGSGSQLPCVWTDPDTGSGEWLMYTDLLDMGTGR